VVDPQPPAVDPRVRPEPKPQPKPQPQPRTPVVDQQPPAVDPRVRPEPKPEPRPQPQPRTPVVDPQPPAVDPRLRPEPKPEPRPQPQPRTPVVDQQPPVVDPRLRPEPKPEPRPQPRTPVVDPQPPAVDPRLRPEPKPGPKPQPQPKTPVVDQAIPLKPQLLESKQPSEMSVDVKPEPSPRWERLRRLEPKPPEQRSALPPPPDSDLKTPGEIGRAASSSSPVSGTTRPLRLRAQTVSPATEERRPLGPPPDLNQPDQQPLEAAPKSKVKPLGDLAHLSPIQKVMTGQAAENRAKYPEWLQVKLKEDATPAYLTSMSGGQRGPKGVETRPVQAPLQAVDAAARVDFRKSDPLAESRPEVIPQAQAAISTVTSAPTRSSLLFQAVATQGLIATQRPDTPKSSETSSSPRRSKTDEQRDREGLAAPGGASGSVSGLPGAGRITGKSEIIESRHLSGVLSGSVGRREGAEREVRVKAQPLPQLAAGWGVQSAPEPEAKLSNGRVVTADVPIHAPVLDELAEKTQKGEAPPRPSAEKPRPLFVERSEDDFHERRFQDDERDRGGRELLERSGNLARAYQPQEKTTSSRRQDESATPGAQHQEHVEDVSDHGGRGSGGGGSQQRDRDHQGGRQAQQASEQQQSQNQRRSVADQKIDLQRLEAYRIAKTDEALKMGLRLAQQPEGKQLSELMNRHAGHSMESLLKKAYRLDSLGELSREEAVNALGLVLKLGGEFTFAHSARVLELAMDLADELGIQDQQVRSQVRLGAMLKDTGEMALMLDQAPQSKLEKISDWLGSQDLRQAGLLHDIGKTKIPPEILYKPGKLTEEEYEIMKLHPVIGEQMVYPIDSLRHLCPVIRGHHERWDGKGYPDGLKGEDIPYAARIIAVADVFDALAAERPYKAGMPVERVQAILREGRGTHFDPDLIDAFERVIQRRHPELSNPFE